MTIHQARKAQVALLLVEEITILDKYSDFADVFLENQQMYFQSKPESMSTPSSWKRASRHPIGLSTA